MIIENLPPQRSALGSQRGAKPKGPCGRPRAFRLRYALLRWLLGPWRQPLTLRAAAVVDEAKPCAGALRDCPGMRVTRGSRRTDLSVFHHGKRQIPATCGGRVPKSNRFSAAGRGCKFPPRRSRRPPVCPLLRKAHAKRFSFDRAQPFSFGKTKENGGANLPGSRQFPAPKPAQSPRRWPELTPGSAQNQI